VAAEPGVRMLLDQQSNDVETDLRHFPVGRWLHPHALMAAEAAEAAGADGNSGRCSLRLRQGGTIGTQGAARLAAELGLDLASSPLPWMMRSYRSACAKQVRWCDTQPDCASFAGLFCERASSRTSPAVAPAGRCYSASLALTADM